MASVFANLNIRGLTDEQVLKARAGSGDNKFRAKKENPVLKALKAIVQEPMVVLLLVASTIYLVVGNTSDALFLAAAILLVAAISIFQDSRSRDALEKLKQFTLPVAKVIRNGEVVEIHSDELVPGDSLILEEGTLVAADGFIIHSNDFSVNESVLTGESMAVFKNQREENRQVYQGSTIASGMAVAQVTATGNNSRLGQIGKSLSEIQDEKTPLEIQIGNFVTKMVIGGVVVFAFVWLINYLKSGDFPDSLLKALTLAMSILPEEIPVAFTTFMALGAWRLMKMGIVVKQMKTVETLGSASVICTDKTGTITQNKMALAKVYVHAESQIFVGADPAPAVRSLIRDAMWASEPIPFDPMEIALHESYTKNTTQDERPDFRMIHEYPLGGKPPMMTHIFENNKAERIIAAKGAPEALLKVSNLAEAGKSRISEAIHALAAEGYRVLGVGTSTWAGTDFPAQQQDLVFNFTGLIAFYDPPKDNIPEVLAAFYKAGIDVKIITGDNPVTTAAIANSVGFRGSEKSMTGEELMKLDEAGLGKIVSDTNIFTRMFPEAKLRIVNALKAHGEVVAMTGDGVNDGPALKAAHIGIAMGKKGTEIAKQAASMILADDDLAKMVEAIRMGRRIYSNLKKAIQYIISIHIPIILIVFIPLVLGWIYPAIFSPVHVIFLELIMGPTCSIIYENEPAERNIMIQPPRPFTATFFRINELATSVVQGFAITAGLLFVYQYSVYGNAGESVTRTMVFVTLIAANIFLTLVNRSFYYSFITTLAYRNNMVFYMIGITVLTTGSLIFVGPFAQFFELSPLSLEQLALSTGIGFLSVTWFEAGKWYTRKRFRRTIAEYQPETPSGTNKVTS
ncbi:cation-translocating P-type ATPase [Daejeonella lutea]|uniref:Ca2+-transporting ATPase n=1 Tax=Daejeonella lutea TaxID=572036 RepID=A0A1T5CWY4_9SPHI|nr:cation-translocating P-type ATPase [Daejeonella lutea]SKB63873.1 Ca2+-transporting ATPase [Daejeonella lutea]